MPTISESTKHEIPRKLLKSQGKKTEVVSSALSLSGENLSKSSSTPQPPSAGFFPSTFRSACNAPMMSPKEGHRISEEQNCQETASIQISNYSRERSDHTSKLCTCCQPASETAHRPPKCCVWNTRSSTSALPQTRYAALQHLWTHQMGFVGWFPNLLTSCASSPGQLTRRNTLLLRLGQMMLYLPGL